MKRVILFSNRYKVMLVKEEDRFNVYSKNNYNFYSVWSYRNEKDGKARYFAELIKKKQIDLFKELV